MKNFKLADIKKEERYNVILTDLDTQETKYKEMTGEELYSFTQAAAHLYDITLETRQETNDRENREKCQRIAEELEHYNNGDFYKCPECGEVITFDDENYDKENGLYKCPECCETVDESDLQALDLYDYLSDTLDFEITIDSRFAYRSVIVYIGLGGPTIWIDTAESVVRMTWGGDKACHYFDAEISTAIDEYFEEIYNNR